MPAIGRGDGIPKIKNFDLASEDMQGNFLNIQTWANVLHMLKAL